MLGSKVMRQRCVDTLITEEPDDRIGHVRICGGDGQQWLSLPGGSGTLFPASLRNNATHRVVVIDSEYNY